MLVAGHGKSLAPKLGLCHSTSLRKNNVNRHPHPREFTDHADMFFLLCTTPHLDGIL